MKIKSIAAICKKNKNIAIFERYSDDGDILYAYVRRYACRVRRSLFSSGLEREQRREI